MAVACRQLYVINLRLVILHLLGPVSLLALLYWNIIEAVRSTC